jgi:formamidopyrimidine-DNA glycosylase
LRIAAFMPELPEVETTRLALAPYLVGQVLQQVNIRVPKLRQPTPSASLLVGRQVLTLTRRAKYILASLDDAHTLLIHLGMSGRFSVFPHQGAAHTPTQLSKYPHPPVAKHDHAILTTQLGELRFNDPRRFGLLLRIPTPQLATHSLLQNLGPEPLGDAFTGAVLHAALRKKMTAIKPTLMDNKVVVGVGNIYASESLFAARLNPNLAANRLSKAQCERLASCIKQVLNKALQTGGSTLRDFRHPTGEAGHFQDEFNVYDRTGQSCHVCGTAILQATQAQRSTYWCPVCQQR